MNTFKRFAPVKKIPEIYPGAFSENAIRWLIANEDKNGFGRCVRRLGSHKILIDLDEFENYIATEGGAKNESA